MTCSKTGCHAYLEQYGEWIYGDAFEYENPAGLAFPPFFAFRVAHREIAQPIYPIKHFTIHKVLADWRDEPYGTILASSVTNHGYEGIPV